jgi:hypothetical protein
VSGFEEAMASFADWDFRRLGVTEGLGFSVIILVLGSASLTMIKFS